MKHLTANLDQSGLSYELLKNYGTGHSVPQTAAHLTLMYTYLQTIMSQSPSSIQFTQWLPLPGEGGGRWGPLLIADGKKYLVR